MADVLVDGVSVGAVTSYTFTNVTANHTIAASFAIDTYTITASAGANGSISPSGSVTVNHGGSQTFTITPTPATTWPTSWWTASSVGAVTSYTFTNVTANHTIAASFAIDIPVVHTITATAGPHGSISPTGSVPVNHGGSQGFTITPDANYNIKTVLVDGVSVGPVSSYTFTNVTADHTITATFVATTISILTDKNQVKVPPGKTAPLQVKLSDEPQANMVVTVAWQSGSPALSVQGVEHPDLYPDQLEHLPDGSD